MATVADVNRHTTASDGGSDDNVSAPIGRTGNRNVSSGWGEGGQGRGTFGSFQASDVNQGDVKHEEVSSVSAGKASEPVKAQDSVAAASSGEQVLSDELLNTVVKAPRDVARKVQTLEELAEESNVFNVTVSRHAGIDLSVLTSSLHPLETLEEPDEVWEFDSLLQELQQRMTAEGEKQEAEDRADGIFNIPTSKSQSSSAVSYTTARATATARGDFVQGMMRTQRQ